MASEGLTEAVCACPCCEGRPALATEAGPLLARRCGGCGGALLSARGAATLRDLLGRDGSALDSALSARTLSCPTCAGPTSQIALGGGFAAPCLRCHIVWVDRALLEWAEDLALRPAPPLPPPSDGGPAAGWASSGAASPRPRPRLRAILAATGLALAAGVVAFLALRPSDPAPRPPPALAAAPAAVPPPPPPPPAATRPAPAALPPGRLLGGRPLSWWRERLEQLSSRHDPESRTLYEATVKRAEANGLVVATEEGVVRVTPSEALLRGGEAP